MTEQSFQEFLSNKPDLSFKVGRLDNGQFVETDLETGTGIAFNWPGAKRPFYNDGGITFIDREIFRKMNTKELEQYLIKGLEVDQITRITGYYTKLSSWNKGKIGELKDRYKEGMGV